MPPFPPAMAAALAAEPPSPTTSGFSSPEIVPLPTSESDIQAEAAERAIYLHAKLAQIRQAYVLEKDGVLPPLAVPKPPSLEVYSTGPAQSSAAVSAAPGQPMALIYYTLIPAIEHSDNTSEWSYVSHPADPASTVYVESVASLDALSLAEGSALSFSSRLARDNAVAARYYDAYRAARIESVGHQLAHRATSRDLARSEAEKSTLKAVLHMHTLERGLRDSGAVLQSAKDVELLLDEISTKEATLKMLQREVNWVDGHDPGWNVASTSTFAAPSTAPWLKSNLQESLQTAQAPDHQQSERIAAHAKDAEDYLLATRVYDAAKQDPSSLGLPPRELVERIMTHPSMCGVGPTSAVDLNRVSNILGSIADEAVAGWYAPPWQSTLLKQVIHIACVTAGMDAAGILEAVNIKRLSLPFEVSPEELLVLLRSDTVQGQVETVISEAQEIVRKHKPSSGTLDVFRDKTAADMRFFDDVPFYLDKEDVRAVLLKPSFIENTLEDDKKRAEQAKADSVPGWARLPKSTESQQVVDAAKTPVRVHKSTEDDDLHKPITPGLALPPQHQAFEQISSAAKVGQSPAAANVATASTANESSHPVNPPSSADKTARSSFDTSGDDWRGQAERMLATESGHRGHGGSFKNPTALAAIPSSTTSKTAGALGVTTPSAQPAKDAHPPSSPPHMSKTQARKAFKRKQKEAARERVAAGAGRKTWQQKAARAEQPELLEAAEAYAAMRERAGALLQALLARHKVLSQDMLAELKLHDRGFYRLSRAEMEVLSQYPEVIAVEGETYVTSAPLPERGVERTSEGKGKGKAEDLVTGNLDAFRRQWNAELGKGDESASDDTEVGIEYDEDADDEGFGSDAFEE